MQDFQRTTISIRPSRMVGILGGVGLSLVLLHLAFILLRALAGHPHVYGLSKLFDLNEENNIPTFFATALLLLCAGMIKAIALAEKARHNRFTRHWSVLAVVFLFLSIDEASSIHELVSMNIKRYIDTSGILFYPWVIPWTILVVIFAWSYLKFLWHLPRRTRFMFCVAGFLYVVGAIGMELFGARHHWQYGDEDVTYRLLVLTEESLELAGILTLLYALADYMSRNVPEFLLRIHQKAT